MPARYAMTERDGATGLDHTWFRKNENRAGRWTSPDPYNGSMSLGDPQSFNRYSYVTNDPVNFVDPSGLNASSGTEIVWCEQDRWDPVTQNYYIGRCYRYAMGSTGSTGTTVTNQPLEGFPRNGAGWVGAYSVGQTGYSGIDQDDRQNIKRRLKQACLKRKARERRSAWNQRLAWGCGVGAPVGAYTVAVFGSIGVGSLSFSIGAPIGGAAGYVVGGILGCANGTLTAAAVGATQDAVFGVGNPEKECLEEAENAFKRT